MVRIFPWGLGLNIPCHYFFIDASCQRDVFSTIANGPNQGSFKYLTDDGNLTVKSEGILPEQEFPAPDYDKPNPVFTPDYDKSNPVFTPDYDKSNPVVAPDYDRSNPVFTDNNEGIEVKYHHVPDNLEDSNPTYQTPPYDTYGYNKASSPRTMYSNPTYSFVKPKNETKK